MFFKHNSKSEKIIHEATASPLSIGRSFIAPLLGGMMFYGATHTHSPVISFAMTQGLLGGVLLSMGLFMAIPALASFDSVRRFFKSMQPTLETTWGGALLLTAVNAGFALGAQALGHAWIAASAAELGVLTLAPALQIAFIGSLALTGLSLALQFIGHSLSRLWHKNENTVKAEAVGDMGTTATYHQLCPSSPS